jgi:hypothetical protein
MSIDHKKIHAAASASFCVRSLMGSVLLCGGLLGAAMAHADQNGDQPRRDQQQPAPRDRHDAHQSEQARQAPDPRSYEARAEEQRRAMQEASRNAEISRRVGRMTPDERRDLRRQINEAGQDIYANPPRRN